MNFGSVSAANSTNVVIHNNSSATMVLKTSSATTTKVLTSTQTKTKVSVNMHGLSNAQILNGLFRAQNFYYTNNRLPHYVSYGTTKISISEFNLILTAKGLKIVTAPKNVWSTVKNVKYFQQDTSYTCGPASLKMDFSHYGMNLNEMGLASYAGSNSNTGSTEAGLINAVNKVNIKYGTHFKAWDKTFTSVEWTGLYNQISHNNPVILHIRSFLNPNSGHYVLLTGMNLYLKQVKIADPSFGGYRILTFSDLLTRLNWVVSTGRSSHPLLFLTK